MSSQPALHKGELAASVAALLAAMAFNHLADGYVERAGARAPVSPDLILRHLPGVDVSSVYWWGAAAFVAFARAVLMNLTPLHIPDGAISVDAGVIHDSIGTLLTVHNDLFFSMHTASPFLASLLFRERWARAVSFAFALLMAATVLLLKTHYSLDVAGAFLVTYALYRLQRRWVEPRVRAWART